MERDGRAGGGGACDGAGEEACGAKPDWKPRIDPTTAPGSGWEEGTAEAPLEMSPALALALALATAATAAAERPPPAAVAIGASSSPRGGSAAAPAPAPLPGPWAERGEKTGARWAARGEKEAPSREGGECEPADPIQAPGDERAKAPEAWRFWGGACAAPPMGCGRCRDGLWCASAAAAMAVSAAAAADEARPRRGGPEPAPSEQRCEAPRRPGERESVPSSEERPGETGGESDEEKTTRPGPEPAAEPGPEPLRAPGVGMGIETACRDEKDDERETPPWPPMPPIPPPPVDSSGAGSRAACGGAELPFPAPARAPAPAAARAAAAMAPPRAGGGGVVAAALVAERPRGGTK